MAICKTLKDWKAGFEQVGILPDLIQSYLEYVGPLLENKVPVIFDFNHLCLLLGRNHRYLASVVNSNINHYREFQIPKRSGGKRLITAPYPALMECQSWIYNSILSKIKIHYAAHGFAIGKSIISNSKVHAGKQHFLKIDLKDFFPSIRIEQIITIFKSLGYSHKVSFYLASICCFGKVLPQGAPSSPVISNIIARNLDRRLMNFSKKFNLNYTRYADDLAFSGESIPVKCIEYITEIIESCGFRVNERKTVLQQNNRKRIVTGISIAEDVIRVPREYKRKLKLEIHCIRKHGLLGHMRKHKIRKPNYLQCVIGKIHFWLSVEPTNLFARQALNDLTRKE